MRAWWGAFHLVRFAMTFDLAIGIASHKDVKSRSRRFSLDIGFHRHQEHVRPPVSQYLNLST